MNDSIMQAAVIAAALVALFALGCHALWLRARAADFARAGRPKDTFLRAYLARQVAHERDWLATDLALCGICTAVAAVRWNATPSDWSNNLPWMFVGAMWAFFLILDARRLTAVTREYRLAPPEHRP